MKTLVFPLLILLLTVTALQPSIAQTKNALKSDAIASVEGSNERFVMHNGEVMLSQGANMVPLSRNVVLPNGTKVDYKSGMVEYATGKKATLLQGDYVTLAGEVVFTAPRDGNTLPADGKFDLHVDRKATPSTTSTSSAANELPTLLTRKIQLLNDKLSLMVPDPAKQDAINKINEQLLTLEAQIGR